MTARFGQDNPILDTFKLVAETRRQLEVVNDRARAAVKQFYRNPADLAAFIERHGTPVHVIRGGYISLFVLAGLGFEPGFIPNPRNGCKRFEALCRLLDWQEDKPGCRVENGIFVLTPRLFTVGYLSHQLHHWMASRAGLNGYHSRAQEVYKLFWNRDNGQITHKMLEMKAEDLFALKDAINRDMEALSFVRQVADEILRPANQGKNLSRGTAQA